MTATRHCRLLLALLLMTASGYSQIAIPATPAGQTLRAWLEALNSGDREAIDAYVKTMDKENSVDGMVRFRQQTGGFDLLSIESSEPLHIRFRVKEKVGPTNALGNLMVKDGQPPTVELFNLHVLPPDVAIENVTLDAMLRKRVMDGVAENLIEFYIDADLAKRMVGTMRSQADKGEYDSITDGDVFAARLTKDLRAVSHDKHLGVSFSPFQIPERKGPPSAEEETRMHQQMERNNCFFQKVEILPNNIGYIKFDAFQMCRFADQPLWRRWDLSRMQML